jgi:clan AA aspartic protease
MIRGEVRDRFPRVALRLSSRRASAEVEFIVDTGFDGEIALPPHLISQLAESGPPGRQIVRFADGSYAAVPAHELVLWWLGEARPVSVLVLEGKPLLGVELLEGTPVQSEMTEGGEVSIEPL